MPKSHSAAVQSLSAHLRKMYRKAQGAARNVATGGEGASDGTAVVPAFEALEPRQLLSVSTTGGWTTVTPGGSSRVIYVSASKGNDSNGGTSASSPVKTLARAEKLVRNGTGDQVLLNRGDTWHESFGFWKWSGSSSSQPALIGAYGSGNRPVVNSGGKNGIQIDPGVHDLAIVGVKFDAAGRGGAVPDGVSSLGKISNVLVEDCEINGYRNDLTLQAFYGPLNNIRLRRNAILDAYSSSTHSQGVFADGVKGLLLEENVFDHNGWGHGAAQTMFNQGAYVTAESSGLVAKGNVFSNNSAFGLQARPGGTVQNNLFYNNANGVSFGLVSGDGVITPGGVTGTVANNVVMGTHNINGLAAGQGISLGNIRSASVVGNVVADQGSGARTPGISIEAVRGTTNAGAGSGTQNLTIADNVVYKFAQGLAISGLTPGAGGVNGLRNLTVTNNDFQAITYFQALTQSAGFNASAEHFSNNTYNVPINQKTPVIVGGQSLTVSAWASKDKGGQNVQVKFPAPGRSVTSYDAGFIAKARAQSKSNWNAKYTAASVVSYIKAGFGQSTAGVPSVPVVSVPQSVTPSPTPTTSSGGSGPKVTINDISGTEGNSGTKPFTFTVRLSTSSKSKATVKWETKGIASTVGHDYVGTNGTLTFNPGETSKTITIQVKGDKMKEPNDTVAVNLLSAAGATIADGQGLAKIINDD